MTRTPLLCAALLAAACSGTPSETPPGRPPGEPVTTAPPIDASSATGNAAAAGACTSDEGAAAAFVKQSGKQLDRDHPCIQRAQHFRGLIMFGDFAYDRGCEPIGALLDCKLTTAIDPARMLDRAGWAAARPPVRETLAMSYLREVHLAWEGSMTDDPDPAKVVQEKDGGVTITAWVAEPPGMTPETTRHLTEFRFSAKGELTSKVLKSETK